MHGAFTTWERWWMLAHFVTTFFIMLYFEHLAVLKWKKNQDAEHVPPEGCGEARASGLVDDADKSMIIMLTFKTKRNMPFSYSSAQPWQLLYAADITLETCYDLIRIVSCSFINQQPMFPNINSKHSLLRSPNRHLASSDVLKSEALTRLSRLPSYPEHPQRLYREKYTINSSAA
ncbi:MAG: hypothetical protein H7A43_04465 [Verrucomicrobia bacterium]|nr:hypothetical protein [Verrucomicrobiota bacterium]